MRFLFIHQNFPAQFRHVACALAEAGHDVVGMGQKKNVEARRPIHPKIKCVMYPNPRPLNPQTHRYLRQLEEQTFRGQAVYRACNALIRSGFRPDVVVAHPGWGESLFLKEIVPHAKHVLYLEFYYSAEGADFGFDPEFPVAVDDRGKLPFKNFPQITSFEWADLGISPTAWQKSRYPEAWQRRIVQLHEGIETRVNAPAPAAQFAVNLATEAEGRDLITLSANDEVVTYVARNLEPYRGFHTFMRAIPELLERRPAARIVIVGGDDVSYGRLPPGGESYRALYSREWSADVDRSRVHFVGRLDYSRYQSLLQISSMHIYLTYPFVLSWSCLEAMSTGCLLLASRTAPVTEVLEHGKNGFLCDFFDYHSMAREAAGLLEHRHEFAAVRQEARQTVIDNFERSTMLKRYLALLLGN